jgi:hypothetical protein
VLTQAFNLVGFTLADGFDFDNVYADDGTLIWDNSRYTVDLTGLFECADSGFADLTFSQPSSCLGSQFSGEFALEPEQTASVPEPGTLVLVALGLGVAGLRRRRSG